MNQPTVSIFTSVRNGARWLDDYLASVQGQTYEDLEVVVCDNASTDGTRERLEDVAAEDPRIRVIPNERDLGQDASFTKAFTLSRGRYAKLLSIDDRLAPTCVERLVTPLEAHPELVLATSSRDLIDEAGDLLPTWSCFRPIVPEDGAVSGRAFGDLVLSTCMNWVGESLFRKDLLRADRLLAFAGRTYPSAGDVCMSLELLAQGDAWFVVDALSQFREHAGQDATSWRRPVVDTTTWLHLVESGRRVGFLADRDQYRSALLTFLGRATDTYVRARAALDERHGPDHASDELQALAEAMALGAGALAAWEATCGAATSALVGSRA